ncbi:MAG: hypothetical protein ACLFVP_09070 [Candidatus Bathyarchaeia archaeon]
MSDKYLWVKWCNHETDELRAKRFPVKEEIRASYSLTPIYISERYRIEKNCLGHPNLNIQRDADFSKAVKKFLDLVDGVLIDYWIEGDDH